MPRRRAAFDLPEAERLEILLQQDLAGRNGGTQPIRLSSDSLRHRLRHVLFPVAFFLCHPERSRGTPDLSRCQPKHPQSRINRGLRHSSFIPSFVSFRAKRRIPAPSLRHDNSHIETCPPLLILDPNRRSESRKGAREPCADRIRDRSVRRVRMIVMASDPDRGRGSACPIGHVTHMAGRGRERIFSVLRCIPGCRWSAGRGRCYLHSADAFGGQPDLPRRTMRQVERAPVHEGAAVIDSHHHRSSGVGIHDANVRAQRQRGGRCGETFGIVHLATAGAASREAGSIPRRDFSTCPSITLRRRRVVARGGQWRGRGREILRRTSGERERKQGAEPERPSKRSQSIEGCESESCGARDHQPAPGTK
jgi:hypothetical protein